MFGMVQPVPGAQLTGAIAGFDCFINLWSVTDPHLPFEYPPEAVKAGRRPLRIGSIGTSLIIVLHPLRHPRYTWIINGAIDACKQHSLHTYAD